jgi:hypothetical protein
MSERWKPEEGEQYWIIAFSEVVQSEWREDCADLSRWRMGNCFKTKEEAESAAEKVKALLLSLHEPVTECNQLPKLTAEVFNCPDCPEWAKWAAVDRNGIGYFFPSKPSLHPSLWVNHSTDKCAVPIFGKFDTSDWQNSLIERPAKLPDWCKVGEWVWTTTYNAYFKVDAFNGLFIDGEDLDGSDYSVTLENTRPARLRPYNADEMKALVGKVLETKRGSARLITQYIAGLNELCFWENRLNADMLLSEEYIIAGKPAGVLEHLENGEWVE